MSDERVDVPGVGRVVKGRVDIPGHQGGRIVRSAPTSWIHEDGRPLTPRELRRVMTFISERA